MPLKPQIFQTCVFMHIPFACPIFCDYLNDCPFDSHICSVTEFNDVQIYHWAYVFMGYVLVQYILHQWKNAWSETFMKMDLFIVEVFRKYWVSKLALACSSLLRLSQWNCLQWESIIKIHPPIMNTFRIHWVLKLAWLYCPLFCLSL